MITCFITFQCFQLFCLKNKLKPANDSTIKLAKAEVWYQNVSFLIHSQKRTDPENECYIKARAQSPDIIVFLKNNQEQAGWKQKKDI